MLGVILAVSFPFALFGAMAIDRWMNGPHWDLGARRKSAWLDGEPGDGDIQYWG